MNYDQNLNYNDPPAEDQEDLWLEDLKSLLNEDPAPNSGRGSGPVQGGQQYRGPDSFSA